MSSVFKSEKGITLIELIFAVGLISIIIALGYMFYFTGVRAFDRNVDRADIQQNVRHSISFITKRLLNANNSAVSVTLRPNAADDLIIGQELYRLEGTTLQVNHNHPNNNTFNPLAENITAFEATKLGEMITVTITGGSAQKSNLFTLETQVQLRKRDP